MLACALSSKAENRIGHCHYNPPLNAENARLFLCCHFSKLLLGIPFRLVEEANDLAGDVLATGLLVIHNTGGGGQDDVAELTGREQLDNPLLEVGEADVVPGEMTPVLLRRPLSWTTILPERWSSTSSNSPM